MKKKLVLNRETLASLQPDVLDAVGGGNSASITVTLTVCTTQTPSTVPQPPRTISVCPSMFQCPSIPSLASAAGGAKGGQ